MVLVLVLALLFVVVSVIEYALHRRRLLAFPIRVQVNGTRGKSSVTRLIAAGLRAGGRRVVAKTTGTRPRFITGDNDERPIRRLGKPNIFEQVRLVRAAYRLRADTLVFENMSLDPQYQEIEGRMLIRPSHHVITNVRSDHLDVMGPSLDDVARAFSGGVPRSGRLFTTAGRYVDVLRSRAGSGLAVTLAEPDDVSDEEMSGFGYVEHKDNVALALAVCDDVGVDRSTALAGMRRSLPDPGAMRVHSIAIGGKRLELVNTLAANDPDSIALLWQLVEARDSRRMILVNCRSDRADRSHQLAELVAGFDADLYVATGGMTRVFLQRAIRAGIPGSRLLDLGENRPPSEVLDAVLARASGSALLFATGNTVGYGEELMEYFVACGEVDGR